MGHRRPARGDLTALHEISVQVEALEDMLQEETDEEDEATEAS